MKYFVIAPEYTGSCVRDEFKGEVPLESLNLPTSTISQIECWHQKYKKIIPMSIEERQNYLREIDELDSAGLKLAKSLESQIPGGAKVKYYSEGKLKYLQ